MCLVASILADSCNLWPVAHLALCPWDSSGKNPGVGCLEEGDPGDGGGRGVQFPGQEDSLEEETATHSKILP